MRRHINVSLALVLGLAAALNTTPLLAMQDDQCAVIEERVQEEFGFQLDCESVFGEDLGVTVTPGLAERSIDEAPYRFYDFQFTGEDTGKETGAYIPERFNSEAMVVSVLSGVFAFRVQNSGVIVDPQGDQPLERYRASIAIPLGEDPEVQTAERNESRVFEVIDDENFTCDLNLPDGRTVCLLDQQDVDELKEGEIFVRLDRGDTVYLPANSTCFLCNTHRIDSDGREVETGGIPAQLLIWSSTTGFSGALERVAAPSQDNSLGTPATQGSGRIVGWMFNPGSNCKG